MLHYSTMQENNKANKYITPTGAYYAIGILGFVWILYIILSCYRNSRESYDKI